MAISTDSETVSSLNGLFKEVYGDEIKDLIPNAMKVQQMMPFVPKQKQIGNKYHQPVILAYPSGFTHAAGDGTAGAFSLNNASPSTMKDAQIQGSQILLREYLDYESAARSAQSRNAFVDGTSLLFEMMQKAHRKRLEIQLLHGGVDLGVVSSTNGSTTVVFTTATWSDAMWAGSEGTVLDAYDTTLATQRTNSMTIQSVNLSTRTLTVDATSTGLAATDRIFFKGAKGNEMSGIHAILANAGSLFNISASTYSMWAASTYSAGSAALTFNKVKAAVAQAVGRGLDEDAVVLMNPKTWDNVLSDLAALRRFVEKQGKGTSYEIGSENVVFYSQNGKIELKPHIFCKEGFAYLVVPEHWKRLGATDVTFETPGYGGQIFTQLGSNAGFEVRSYCHEAVFCEKPARQVLISSIVNA